MTQHTAPKILVIDDEVTQRMLVKEYLEEAGYLVRLSEDGRHGMKMAASTSPDLILVDVLLPSVDGYQVCAELRRHPKTADTPIILITASKETDAIAKGLAAGATDFITKPVEFPFLADRVGHVIQKARDVARLQAEKNLIEEQLRATQSEQFEAKPASAGESKSRDAEAAAEARLVSAREEFDQETQRIRTEAQAKIAEAEAAIAASKQWLDREVSSIKASANAEIARTRSLLDEAHMAKTAAQSELGAISSKLDAKMHELRSLRAAADNELRMAKEALSQQAGAYWGCTSALSSTYLSRVRSILESAAAVGGPEAAGIIGAAQDLNVSLANFNILARHLSGQIKLDETKLDLAAQLNGIAAAIEPVCARRKLRIETRVDPTISFVLGDERHLRFLLMNLLANAIHYSPVGGTITIDAGLQPDSSIRIAIRDRGVGMLPAELARIRAALEPTNMIGSRQTTAGFGVPIATCIAHLHGGRLEFQSAAGDGTTAIVVLPRERHLTPGSRMQAVA